MLKKKTQLNYPVIVLSQNKQSLFTFNFSIMIDKFPADILDNLKQHSSQ